MWKAETGELKYKLESGIQPIEYNGEKYIVHPAFMGTGSEDLGGGFGTDEKGIEGFWVAKYEMSRENSSDGTTWTPHGTSSSGGGNVKTESNTIRAVSKPGVTSWKNINIGNMYTNSINYGTSKESHLMKNSEWGAVAYLTHSQYGRNGYEITINSDMSRYTGGSLGATALTNKKQSSTGNETGIYDLSGGVYEYVAAFNDTDTGNYFSSYGWTSATGLTTSSSSTKYATKYSNSSTTYSGTKIYTVGKTGDATKEVYTGSGHRNWFSDYPYVVASKGPFFRRGGECRDDSDAGVFNSIHNSTGHNTARQQRFPCMSLKMR